MLFYRHQTQGPIYVLGIFLVGVIFMERRVVSRHIEILLDRFHGRNFRFQFFRNHLVKFICLPRNHIVQLILFAPASFCQPERRQSALSYAFQSLPSAHCKILEATPIYEIMHKPFSFFRNSSFLTQTVDCFHSCLLLPDCSMKRISLKTQNMNLIFRFAD